MSEQTMPVSEVLAVLDEAIQFMSDCGVLAARNDKTRRARAAVAELAQEVERLKAELQAERDSHERTGNCVTRERNGRLSAWRRVRRMRRRVDDLEKARSALESTLIDIRDETGNEEAALAAADAIKTWGDEMSTKAEIAARIVRDVGELERCSDGPMMLVTPDELRDIVLAALDADRLDAVAVDVGVLIRACTAYNSFNRRKPNADPDAMRAALESILPIADEQMTTRYKWLRNRMTVTEVQELERRGDQSEEAYEAEIDRAIDNAIASARGDATK